MAVKREYFIVKHELDYTIINTDMDSDERYEVYDVVSLDRAVTSIAKDLGARKIEVDRGLLAAMKKAKADGFYGLRFINEDFIEKADEDDDDAKALADYRNQCDFYGTDSWGFPNGTIY